MNYFFCKKLTQNCLPQSLHIAVFQQCFIFCNKHVFYEMKTNQLNFSAVLLTRLGEMYHSLNKKFNLSCMHMSHSC